MWLLNRVLATSGIQVQRNLRFRLDQLAKSGTNFRVVWDVGAHIGEWSQAASRIRAFKGAEFVLFEANESHASSLEKRAFPFHIAALGSEPRKARFYSTAGTGDSLYRENTNHYAAIEPRTVHLTTLDILREEFKLKRPDFLKIDVQGAEKEIIEGGWDSLQFLQAALCEISVSNYNEGAPTLPDMFRVMGQLGLLPRDILERHFHNGALIQVDVLFVRHQLLSFCSST